MRTVVHFGVRSPPKGKKNTALGGFGPVPPPPCLMQPPLLNNEPNRTDGRWSLRLVPVVWGVDAFAKPQ